MRHSQGPLVTVCAIALLTTTLTLPAAGAFHSDAPLLYQDAGDGSTGWGIEVAHETTGDIAIDLHADIPVTASEVSIGGVFFDDGQPSAMIAITSHISPERTTLTAGPLGELPAPTVTKRGDTTLLDEAVEVDTAETAPDCPFICLALNAEDAQPGDHHFVTWAGGFSTTELFVRSTGEATATANKGPSHVLGDAELTGGTVNAQLQRDLGGQTVGLKAMLDVPYHATVEGELFGFWARSTVKVACPGAGGCLTPTSAFAFCQAQAGGLLPGVACNTASLGWSGPGDAGGSGGSFYDFLGEPSGDYAFTVEHKLDPYGPLVFDPATQTFVWWGEDHSFLTVTDVAVP